VRLDNNQTYTIALNKRFDRDNLQGLQGQPIRFHGQRASLNGRDVVKAKKIRIDGERLRKQNQNRNQNQND
jgi:hypothetical protein